MELEDAECRPIEGVLGPPAPSIQIPAPASPARAPYTMNTANGLPGTQERP